MEVHFLPHLLQFLRVQLCDCVDQSKVKVYSDIPGFQTTGGGTILPDLLITPQRPDIVILTSDSIDIWELTVPFENNIQKRHQDKEDKYVYMLTDIKSLKSSVNAFGLKNHIFMR